MATFFCISTMLHDRPFTKYILFALLLVVIDQVVKLVVKLNMQLGEKIVVIDGFFSFLFVENEGAAFGMTFSSLTGTMDPITAKLLLTLLSLVLVALIIWYLYKIRNWDTLLPFFVAMILGGALGNIIDRVFYGVLFDSINYYEGGLLFGRVVDMFAFDLYNFTMPDWVPGLGGSRQSTPIWNVADMFIFVGIAVILLFQKRLFPEEETHGAKSDAKPAPQTTPAPDTKPASNQATQP